MNMHFRAATHVMTSIEKPSSPKSRSPNATTPVTPTAPRGRGTKRKGGWKFHDLSDESDGLGRRKRAYANSKLENEILLVGILRFADNHARNTTEI